MVFAILADPAKQAAIDGTGWVQVFDPPSTISWEPGSDTGDGTLRFGGWVWRPSLGADLVYQWNKPLIVSGCE